jgi:3',5'-cyclic AMP phosphodiesterase CpdA
VNGQLHDHNLSSGRFDPEVMRRQLAALAAAIAGTEDRVADTFERLALTHPHDASGLLARAAQARQYAMLERNRAAVLNRHVDRTAAG